MLNARLLVLAVLVALTACRERHPAPPVVQPPADSTDAAADFDVMDTTAELTADDTIVSSTSTRMRGFAEMRSATTTLPGLALGLSGWDLDQWSAGPMTGTNLTSTPKYLPTVTRLASETQIRFAPVVPRRLMTVNGETRGRWSLEKSKAAINQYVPILPTLLESQRTGHFMYLIILDDMDCADCWGGAVITPEQAEQIYAYAKQKLPGLTFGIRVIPEYVTRRPSLSKYVDVAVAQYLLKRGNVTAFYDRAKADAASLPYPMRLAEGINFSDFPKVGERTATADELRTYLGIAIDRPENCFANSWYASTDWKSDGRDAVWDTLAAKARARTDVPRCARD